MSQSYSPSLIPTTARPNYRGSVPLSPNVLQASQIYYQQRPVYGAPSMISATAVVREHVKSLVGIHTAAPERNEYDVKVIWLGNITEAYKGSLGSSVATQKARSFGGSGAPYYQALRAPSISDVAAYMGGVVNGR